MAANSWVNPDGSFVALPPEVEVDADAFQSILDIAKREGISPSGYQVQPDADDAWIKYAYFAGSEQVAVNQVYLCRHWLRACRLTKGLSKFSSTYGWKHVIERTYGYFVCNGALLVACYMVPSIRVERCGRGEPNAYLNISQRALPTRETA